MTVVVDRSRELAQAKRWAHRAPAARSERDRKRLWRLTMEHLKAFLSGEAPDPRPESRALFDREGAR